MHMLMLFICSVAPWPDTDDWHEILVRQEDRVLRVRLILRSEDRSYRQGWMRQVDRLFRHLDVNNDGVLDASEARRAPGQEQWQQMAAGERIIDPEPAPTVNDLAGPDGRITSASFRAYYSRTKAGPLIVNWQQHRPNAASTASDRLASLLLPDRKQPLTAKHLEGLAAKLQLLDRNDDETISVQEMQDTSVPVFQTEPRQSRGQATGPAPFDMPLELLGPGSPLPRGLSLDPDVVLILELVDTAAHPVRVIRAAKGTQVISLRGGVQVTLPGLALRIGVDVPRSAQRVREDAKARFATLDQNRDKVLDSKELHMPPFEYVSWLRLADLNADGKLTEAEFMQYAELLAEWHGHRTVLKGSDDGRSLFSFLDLDGDQRLSLREQNEACKYLPPPTPAKETTTPFPPRVIRLQLGRDDSPMETPRTTPNPRQVPLVGPLWFQKMDTNSDGDLSRREWLGPRPDFDHLDTNKDGLISLEEAIRYQNIIDTNNKNKSLKSKINK